MRDITLEETVYFNFTTRALATGVPTTLSGSPVLSVLESNNATPITAGVSVQVDRASVAGLNQATIAATAANGYEAGKSYAVYISTGTVGGTSVVGEVVAEFTVQAAAAFTRIGAAGAGLTALASASALTTVDTVVDAIKAVTDALPDAGALTSLATAAALATVDGNVDSILVDTAEIGAAGAGLTALPWNAAWDAQVESEVADALTAYDAATGTDVTSATSGLATAANLATVAGYLDTEIAAILADTNELQTDWANGGRLDLILDARASQASVDTIDGIVDDILVDTAEIGAAGAGLTALATAAALATVDGNVDSILVTSAKLDDTLEDDGGTFRFTANALEEAPSGTGASAASIVAAMFTVDTGETEADAVAGSVVYEIVQNSGGGGAPTVGEIADEVQTRTIAAVTLVNGLAANTVTASALASDAVAEIQSGLATAAALADVDTVVDAILVDTAEIGAAGAGLTALASASLLTTVAGYLDTEIAAIKAVTDAIPNAGAMTSIATAAALATVDSNVDAILVDTAEIGAAGAGLTALASAADLGTVDTVVDAIKAKTDSLTFTVANQVRADVRYVNGTQVTGNGSPGSEWGPL